jgi:release factor glutamine methyltransferase
MNSSIEELLNQASTQLKASVPRPRLEAEILLAYVLEQERIWLHLHFHDRVEPKNYFELIQRRVQNEPIEYITGKVSFYGEDFLATPGVLIARPETELLIDHAMTIIERHPEINTIAEIGVGSGIISIILAKKYPHLSFIASDINQKALTLTKANMNLHNIEERISLFHTSLLDTIETPIDMIVSNPPYIANSEPLEAHVLKEPSSALFGGVVGDELLKDIIDLSIKRNISYLICEMGYDQKEPLTAYLKNHGRSATFYKDYSNFDRGFFLD